MDGTPDLGHQWASLVTTVAAHRGHQRAGREPDPSDSPNVAIPATLLTGFLGAGKSTLLAKLLADPGDAGVVRAVVNDVGRLPFDPTLIANEDAATVELTNGCGCCVAGAAAELAERLDQVAIGADLVVLAGWNRVLTDNFLAHHSVINLHPAKPGAFPGLGAIERAYEAWTEGRVRSGGVMVHFVPDEGVDTGPVIASEEVPFLDGDTLDAFEARVHAVEHRLLVDAIATVLEEQRTAYR